MAFLPAILEQGFLGMILDPPTSPSQAASRFATFYEKFAMTATPPVTVTGKKALMEKALFAAFLNPKAGVPPKGINAINQGMLAFWIGVPVPAGVVTAYLGAPVLMSQLAAMGNPKIPAQQAAKMLALAHANATRLVQYLIPPGPPAFLV